MLQQEAEFECDRDGEATAPLGMRAGANGGARGAGLPLPGPLTFTPRPAAGTSLSPAVPPQLSLQSSAVPQPPLGPLRATRRVPAPPGTCGRFPQRPLPSRQSERPWTPAGLRGGLGRPLVAVVAGVAAPGQHLDGAGGAGPQAPPRPHTALPCPARASVSPPPADLRSQGKTTPFQSCQDPSLVTRRN